MPGEGHQMYSEETSREIDIEVRKVVNEAYSKAKQILEDNMDILHAMKDALMEYETIDSDQVDDLMARRPVRPPQDWSDHDLGSSSGGKGRQSEDGQGAGDSVGGPANQL